MDKYILCLANSYKHGGRCIAGIEVTINNNIYSIVRDANGAPKWLRPISHSVAGEVPNSHAANIRVLSIVKITGVEYAGMYSHSEDVYYQSLSVHSNVKSTHNVLTGCIDNYHSTIFGNRGKALTPECFQNGTYSVMLVFAKDPEVYIDTRFNNPKARMKFVHNGNNYDFPITDPIFLDRIQHEDGCIGRLSDVFLVLSLGVEHEGWHSKLVAAIIETQKGSEQIVAPPLNINNGNRVPNFTTKRDDTIVCNQQTEDSKKRNESSPQPTYNTQKNNRNSTDLKESKNLTHLTKSLTDINGSESKHVSRSSTSIPKQKSEGCYIATAVYGSYDAPEVMILRNYRDTTLKRSYWGRLFVCIYYAVSPYIANKMKKHNRINNIVKMLLDKMVTNLRDFNTDLM